MPTYEYLCENCGNELEQFQSITAKPLRKCPACGKNSLKRLLGTGSGVIFKGSGFYQTDYRSQSYKKAKENEKQTTTKKDTDADKKKDTKSSEKTRQNDTKKEQKPA